MGLLERWSSLPWYLKAVTVVLFPLGIFLLITEVASKLRLLRAESLDQLSKQENDKLVAELNKLEQRKAEAAARTEELEKLKEVVVKQQEEVDPVLFHNNRDKK